VHTWLLFIFLFITIFNSTITFFPLYKWTSWFFHKWRGFYSAIIMLKLILTKGVTGNRIFLRARLPEHVASPRKERALRRYNTTRHCSSACNSRMSHNFPFFYSKCQDKNFAHTRNARIYSSLVSFNNIFLEDASAYISLNIFMQLFWLSTIFPAYWQRVRIVKVIKAISLFTRQWRNYKTAVLNAKQTFPVRFE